MQRDLYFYLGRNKKHDYPATPIGNMIMFDPNYRNQQISAFTHNLIIRLIQEYNPRDIDITLVTLKNGVHADFHVWQNALTGQRIIPQIKNIIQFEETSESVTSLTKELLVNKTSSKQHVIIIDWSERLFSSLSESQREEWKSYLNRNSTTGRHFVFLSNDYACMEDIIPYCEIKATLNTSKEISYKLFSSDIANTTFTKGQVYLKDRENEVVVLYIPFFPDTWIEKFCRYYGVINERYEKWATTD